MPAPDKNPNKPTTPLLCQSYSNEKSQSSRARSVLPAQPTARPAAGNFSSFPARSKHAAVRAIQNKHSWAQRDVALSAPIQESFTNNSKTGAVQTRQLFLGAASLRAERWKIVLLFYLNIKRTTRKKEKASLKISQRHFQRLPWKSSFETFILILNIVVAEIRPHLNES